MHHLCIDMGGTKTSISVATSEGQFLEKVKFPTLKGNDVGKCVETILSSCRKFTSLYPIDSVGLSVPGSLSVSKKKFLYPPNLLGWENFEIARIIEENLQKRVYFNNDGNAAVLAEYYFGEHKGCNNLIYLTASTGMGGGIIAEGCLIQGATDTAGEVGHMPIELHTTESTGGVTGSWENYCGGYAFAEHIKKILSIQKPETLLNSHPIHSITMHEILHAVRANDPFALKEFGDFTKRLAQGIAILIMTLNPEAIVLGTIAMHAQDLLMIPLRKALVPLCWKEPLNAVSISPSKLTNIGDLAALSLCLYGKDV